MSDAFLAGYHPKKTPIPIEIKKDSKIEAIETWTKTGVKVAIKKDTNIPNKIPRHPPVKQTNADSIRNCLNISSRLAPIANLIPISLVLSVTLTNIIFIIPTPPTSSEIPAIDANKILKASVAVSAVEEMSARLDIEKSFFSSSLNL
jgi:hypothetical protein